MGFSNDDGCGHDAATLASSATTASESSITPMSIVGKILQDAEHDLDNSEWPGMMGTVLHPVRDTFWLPPLRFFNQHIAPIATSALPSTIDHAVGAVVGVTSGAIRFTYGILPHIPSLSEFAVQEIETTSLLTFNRLPSRDSVSDAISQLFSLFGFVLNSILDLLTNPAQKYSAFLNTIKMFAAFLMRTGITTELSNAIATRNAVTNMMLVARIQGSLDDSRRADVAFRTPPFTPKEEMHLLQESKRHLQYATAAYGTFQISASDSLPQDHQQQQKGPLMAAGIIDDAMDQLQKKFRRRIAKYLGLAEEDILYMTSPGEELSVIPHFVAIEKATKSLILALRGTNSLTGVFTDIDATTSM
ncbi:hypothetical protein MHU86_6798 [Fragilaria crotonensis]|nr:hypothetical protein MHU86_6798 [Fragilaria crotonensis]